jgi:hypothetical protein
MKVANQRIAVDRIAVDRIAVDMELRYSYRAGDVTYIGTGRIRNMNTSSVYFEIDQQVCAQQDVELSIAWPSKLQRTCSLELVLRGPIVPTGPNCAVQQTKSYEFRTCGDRSFSSLSGRAITCDIAA